MHINRTDVSAVVDIPGVTIRATEAGNMTIEAGTFSEQMDCAPLFVGLPDNRCQCPHWGYVLSGSIRFSFADREETFSAGEVYYAEPGHTPTIEAGTEYVEYSPTVELNKSMEVAMQNAAKLGLPV